MEILKRLHAVFVFAVLARLATLSFAIKSARPVTGDLAGHIDMERLPESGPAQGRRT